MRFNSPLSGTIARLENVQTILPASRCDDLACAITCLINNALRTEFANGGLMAALALAQGSPRSGAILSS